MIDTVKQLKQEHCKGGKWTWPTDDVSHKGLDLKHVPIDKLFLRTIDNIAQKPYSHFDLQVDFKNAEI